MSHDDPTIDPPDGPAVVAIPGTVLRQARGAGRERLRREADVLRVLAGLPVVSLVELDDRDDTTVVRTLDAGPTTAADPSLPRHTRLAALAAGCRALAELHRSGWAHGQPTADHLVVGPRGRARWCSLGRATPLSVDPLAAARDRVILTRAVADATARDGRRLARRLRRLGDAPSPEALAGALGRPSVARGFRPALRAGVPLAVGAALAGAALRSDTSVAGPGGPGDHRPTAAVTLAGVGYRVGRPGDQLAIAEPGCGGSRSLWVLRPGSGEVVVFDDLTSVGSGGSPRSFAVVPDASGWAPSSRCGAPAVRLVDGRTVTLPAP